MYDLILKWSEAAFDYTAATYYTIPTADLAWKRSKGVQLLLISAANHYGSEVDTDAVLVAMASESMTYNDWFHTAIHAAISGAGWTGSGGNFVYNLSGGTPTIGVNARAGVRDAVYALAALYQSSRVVSGSGSFDLSGLELILDKYFWDEVNLRPYAWSLADIPQIEVLRDVQTFDF